MRHYDTIAELEREGFKVIVDKTWEDLHPSDMFEESDVAEICDKIDRGVYDWFMLRVRVMLEDVELGSHYLGGCCYTDAAEVMTDGTAEDCIDQALFEAKGRAAELARKLTMITIKHSDGVYA